MSRRTHHIACVVLIIGLTGFAAQTQAQPQRAPVYIALGDSIAFGVGSSLPERRSYPSIISAILEEYSGTRTEMVNHSVPGETASSFLTEGQLSAFVDTVQRYVESGVGIGVVTLSLGGNDILAGQPGNVEEREQALADFRTNYEEAIARIQAEVGRDATLVITTYYDLSEGDPSIESSDSWWIEQFNQAIRETAGRHGAVVAEIGEAFRGNIAEYTHHPYDIHPKNQGYRAIARQVWSAIGFDQEPPEVQVTSSTEATRRTPTLQFMVEDNVDVASVTVRIDAGTPVRPVDTGDGHYVLLLDLRGDEKSTYDILISARDSAGNLTEIEHRIAIVID